MIDPDQLHGFGYVVMIVLAVVAWSTWFVLKRREMVAKRRVRRSERLNGRVEATTPDHNSEASDGISWLDRMDGLK